MNLNRILESEHCEIEWLYSEAKSDEEDKQND